MDSYVGYFLIIPRSGKSPLTGCSNFNVAQQFSTQCRSSHGKKNHRNPRKHKIKRCHYMTNPNNSLLLLMVQKSQTTTWDVSQTHVNNGINYQPQLVSLPDFSPPQRYFCGTPETPLHPGRLTWNLTIRAPWKSKIIFQIPLWGCRFKFHHPGPMAPIVCSWFFPVCFTAARLHITG